MPLPSLILGNSNKRFSGVTSTMLQTLPEVQARMPAVVMGHHHLPEGTPAISFKELIAQASDGQPRIFHARRNIEMVQALIAKKIFKIPLKIAFTSTAQRNHTRFTKGLIKQMDGIISTCSAAASYLERKPDIIIPHGIDLDRYQPPANKRSAWQALGFPGKYGIGIFGRIRPQKGIDLFVEASLPLLKENPDPTIIIVGETTPKFRHYQKELEEKIAAAELSDRIIFHGKRPSSELPGLFQGMSLVAALSRNEGFGLTVLEAMASECAVLASHAGAWQDIITEGIHGFTVPCGKIPATRNALSKLMANPEKLLDMGRAGRAHVASQYTIQREAASLCDYYQQLQKGLELRLDCPGSIAG